MQSENTTRSNTVPIGPASRRGRTALVTTALALGIGSLALANPAAARDEFKNAFEFELGRIVAHQVASVGHAVLTPHVAMHREIYRAPRYYYSHRSPRSYRHPHRSHYKRHSHARHHKRYRSCWHRHDRHDRYSRRDHRTSDRRHRHDHRVSERRDRHDDRVRDRRDRRDERTSRRRDRHDY